MFCQDLHGAFLINTSVFKHKQGFCILFEIKLVFTYTLDIA